MPNLILALVLVFSVFVAENTEVFEDGSYRTGTLTGCLPGGLCSLDYQTCEVTSAITPVRPDEQ